MMLNSLDFLALLQNYLVVLNYIDDMKFIRGTEKIQGRHHFSPGRLGFGRLYIMTPYLMQPLSFVWT